MMKQPSSPSAEGIDDFETNNQEDDVDESDLLRTKGEYAFAGYGNYVVVWEVKTGRNVTNVTLPPINNTNVPPLYHEMALPLIVEPVEAPADEEAPTTPAPATPGKGGKNRRNLSKMMYNPRPNVKSLLLHNDELVVIACGYGPSMRNELDYVTTLYDAFNTNIRIYDISKLPDSGEVTFIKETHVHCYFNSARVFGNNMHLVTFASLNTYPFFEEPLWNLQQQGLTQEDYIIAARKLAEDKLIPGFNDNLIRDLSSPGELTDVAGISM